MMSYVSTEPTVIDEDLIRKAINEQLDPEIADTAKKEGIDSGEVVSLRLDYKSDTSVLIVDILKIDNLWIYESIRKLQLDNNIIEKIENINFLVNLTWLDLSFNNISKIEGLDSLSKLTDLTLYNNRITVIENMEDLVNLQVFSIGNNNIGEIESFECLRVLNVSGNPLTKNAQYKPYAVAHLKNLQYLDYRLIEPETVVAAKEKFIDSIIALEEEEKVAKSRRDDVARASELDNLHERAHILHIDSRFDMMFDNDLDFKKLLPIAPTIIIDLKEEFRAKFDVIAKELKHFVLKRTADKQDEVVAIRACIKSVTEESDQNCLLVLEKYHHDKKELIKTVQNSRNPKEVDDALKDLREITATLSSSLMGAELILVEQFEDVIKEFERCYTEIANSVTETGVTSIARLREMESEFVEKLGEAVMGMFERITKGDIEEVDDEIMADKDSLMNSLNAAHDFRLSQIDAQEDMLVAGISKETDLVVKQIQSVEIKRNRDRVGEIIAFLEKCYADIDFAEENSY